MEIENWSSERSATQYDTFCEVWALDDYIKPLEGALPSLVEKERHRLRQDLRAGDEQGLYYTELAEHQVDEGITTRLVTGTALITIWGTFESAIRRATQTLNQPQTGILDITKRLFTRLAIQYPNQIGDFYDLRNALAHANGRIEDMGLDTNEVKRQEKSLRIEQLVSSYPDLKISHDGYLIVSIEFVRVAFEFIEPLLLDIAKRTDQERVENRMS